jgi:hypothetical protein
MPQIHCTVADKYNVYNTLQRRVVSERIDSFLLNEAYDMMTIC